MILYSMEAKTSRIPQEMLISAPFYRHYLVLRETKHSYIVVEVLEWEAESNNFEMLEHRCNKHETFRIMKNAKSRKIFETKLEAVEDFIRRKIYYKKPHGQIFTPGSSAHYNGK